MTGHITDGVGFILNLKEHGVEGQKMVIIGTVFIEDLDNKEKFAEVVSESNILVNATRAGMALLENVIPEPEERLRPELAVADVVYNLLETLLVKKQDAVPQSVESECFCGREPLLLNCSQGKRCRWMR